MPLLHLGEPRGMTGAFEPALRAAIATLTPPAADRDGVASDALIALERLPEHRRARLVQFIALLELPRFCWISCCRWMRFSAS